MVGFVFNFGTETSFVVSFVMDNTDVFAIGFNQTVMSSNFVSITSFMLAMEIVVFWIMYFVFVVIFWVSLDFYFMLIFVVEVLMVRVMIMVMIIVPMVITLGSYECHEGGSSKKLK